MVLPAQFQLGLELTNIVNPISQAVSALGSLAVIDAIKKSGSDFITETKLASLIGRHRIDPVIKFHFREMVAKSDQSVISRYLDIILESGSGPTVQEALKNPALFSMVIQLSGLAFAHEDESLASAIVEAIEKIVQESDGDVGIVPDYVSLLGTVRACQQQTAAFRWALLYEAVEEKIKKALAGSDSHRTKSRKRESPDRFFGLSGASRSLPVPVLQGLFMWLQSLKRFPEHRLLHLRCDTGISTVVVWCHHILGLSLTMDILGTEIRFGNTPYNLIVEESPGQTAGVSLMDPVDPQEPLFTLQNDGNSMGISYEHRAEAHGYGIRLLQWEGIPEMEWKMRGKWVILYTVCLCEDANSNLKTPSNAHNDGLHYPSRARLINAGRVLFAFDENVSISILSSVSYEDSTMIALAAIVITFARISNDDLARWKELPLNLNVLPMLSDNKIKRLSRKYLDLVQSFEILSLLLLGRHLYNADYVEPAFLLSAWGWSVYLDSIDAVDPSDVSVNTLRVLRGVPSRRGFRRTRIIDGPHRGTWPATVRFMSHSRARVYLAAAVSTVKKGVILIGHHSDAFQVTQQFTDPLGHFPECGYGFRELLECSIKSSRLSPCRCNKPESDISTSTSETITSSARKVAIIDSILKAKETKDISLAANQTFRSPDLERVFTSKDRSRHFVYVSDNPAARWLQLQALHKHRGPWDGDPTVPNWSVVLGDQETCIDCAIRNSEDFPPNGILLL